MRAALRQGKEMIQRQTNRLRINPAIMAEFLQHAESFNLRWRCWSSAISFLSISTALVKIGDDATALRLGVAYFLGSVGDIMLLAVRHRTFGFTLFVFAVPFRISGKHLLAIFKVANCVALGLLYFRFWRPSFFPFSEIFGPVFRRVSFPVIGGVLALVFAALCLTRLTLESFCLLHLRQYHNGDVGERKIPIRVDGETGIAGRFCPNGNIGGVLNPEISYE